MAARRRTPFQIVDGRRQVASMYLRGMTQQAIANELGYSRDMVKTDLEMVRLEWRKSAIHDVNEKRFEQLARIDELEREAWANLEASKLAKDITTTRQRKRGLQMGGRQGGEVPVDQVSEASKRTENRPDAAAIWAQVILNCIDRRCKLLGLDAPQELHHTGNVITEVFYEPATPTSEQRLVVLGPGSRNGTATPALQPPDSDSDETNTA